MTKAVLFDLDGTLTDREPSIRAFRAGFREMFDGRLAAITDKDLEDMLVRSDAFEDDPGRGSYLRHELPWVGEPPDADLVEKSWDRHSAEWVVVRPHAHAVLDSLRSSRCSIGIVTNGPSGPQRRKVEKLGLLDRVDVVVASEDIGFEKPDSRIFEHALGLVGACAQNSWFVGDNPKNDIAGAEALGMRAVWVRSLFAWPSEAPPPAYSINDLDELLPLLRLEEDLS